MELSTRITERLDFLSMSQAELARRAGIPQTTINSLIKRNRRSSPHLVKIARELHTTPAYLTGETDDPASNQPDDALSLSAEEREMIDYIRSIEPEDRKAIFRLTRTIAISARSPAINENHIEFRGP